MVQPINYTVDVQTPFQAALQGYQAGAAIRQDQVQAQQQQAALDQQQRQQQVIRSLLSNPNPTAKDYSDAMLQVPGMAEQFKQSWATRNEDQQRNDLDHIGQVYAALQSGSPEVATQLLQARADALKNSGRADDAKSAQVMADVIKQNPAFARTLTGMKLASIAGGDKVIESIGKLGAEQRAAEQAPADLRAKVAGAEKAEQDVETARVLAKYADQNAILDIQKKGWDIKKVAADIEINKERNRIESMRAATERETNDLKRQELQLKMTEARQTLDDKIRAKVADAESSAATMDNMLNTIERLKQNPALGTVVGPVQGKDMYPHTIMGSNTLATMGITASAEDRENAIALIEQLGSQAFLSQAGAMKGMGALSNAEGEKLQAALTNLKRTQGEKQFKDNLDEAFRLVNKARQNLSTRTGVPLSAPDIPAAKPKNGSSDFQAPAGGGGAPTTTKGGATVSSW